MSDSENQKSDASQPEFSHWILWERYVAGEELSQRQSEVLSDALKHDTEFRRDALAEQTVDQMLRLEAEAHDQTERFLAQVISKCKPAADDHALGTSATQPPNARMLDRALLQNITKDRQNSRKDLGGLFQTKNSLLAMAATVLVSITGVGFWYQKQNARNQSNQSLDLSGATKNNETKEESISSEGPGVALGESNLEIAQSNVNEKSEPATETYGDSVEPKQTADIVKKQLVLATVTKAERLEESSTIFSGSSLSKERFEISQGEIEIAMSNGVKVNVYAPCRLELLSENAIRLIAGELSVAVPNQTNEFLLETPAIAVANMGSAFDIVVEETGRTEVEVRRGGIAIQAIDYPNAQAWNLTAEATNSLVVYTYQKTLSDGLSQDVESSGSEKIRGPIASFARSLSGEKIGVITFNGQSRSFDDEVVFSKVREQVFQGVRSPGESFSRNWSRFVETAANEPQPAGSIQLNGKEYPFDNYNEAVLAQNNVLAQYVPSDKRNHSSVENDDQAAPPVANYGTAGGFQGTLFIRGQRRDFNNFEEYQTAMRELMGPAAEFGFFPFGK
jgi:hypothetical protein